MVEQPWFDLEGLSENKKGGTLDLFFHNKKDNGHNSYLSIKEVMVKHVIMAKAIFHVKLWIPVKEFIMVVICPVMAI